MKPVIIIAIAVVAGIGILVIMDTLQFQQSQIDNMKRQMQLEFALDNCTATTSIFNPEGYERCLTVAIETYGTNDQLQRWNDIRENEETMEKQLLEYCREKWIGQLNEYFDCIEEFDGK